MCSFVFWYVSFFGFCFCSFSVSAAFLLLHMLLLFFLTVLCFLKLCFCAFHFVCSSLLLLFFCFGNCFAFCFLFLLTFLALVSPSVHVSPFLASHRFFALLLFLLFCACVAFPCFSLLLLFFCCWVGIFVLLIISCYWRF